MSVSKRDQTMNEFKYNIGYALSGGFIKGFAHLGIMQALHEHGIRPEILSGVSAGALAAVFYADGKERKLPSAEKRQAELL